MSKIPTTHYTTRVQLAAPPDLAVHFYKLLHTCTDFQILNETLTDGASLLGNIHVTRPDILMLDVLLPNLELKAVFKALGGLRYPPYVIITAPRYDPHLAQAERYRVVKGTLLHGLATSPLLVPVMKGIAEGHEYFTPEAALNLRFSDLTHEETVLLALMAVGTPVNTLVQGLGCSTHVIYTSQCRMRKKLGVVTNEQAILVAIRRKLVAMLTEPGDRVVKEIA